MTRTCSRLAAIAASLLALLALASPALATDPDHVNFTLEGCRLPVGATLPSNIICDDSQYTTGNLGKSWNELDLVPYRLTADSNGAEQTYTVVVALDAEDASKPGYDVISAPVLNDAHSDDGCEIKTISGEKLMGTAGSGGGLGGIDVTRYRELEVHQDAGATCVFDYYGRLAIGSHEFPGSSLHANKALVVDSDTITVSGIGAADVSIPVKEIAPQELSKNMSANQGSAFTWSVNKTTSPSEVNFGNTCAYNDAERTTQVTVTVTWERIAPQGGSGDITLVTHVFATNPAARTITVNVSDQMYAGADQSSPLGLPTVSGAVDVPANTSNHPVLTHTQTVPAGTATSFNDIATATYIDKLTGVPVTGNTTAAASANVQVSNNPLSGSAEIRDTEQITGAGLSFSTTLPTGTVGSFSGYTAGTPTTDQVSWSSGTVSDSGQAVFTKTIYLDKPRATTGQLSDQAGVFITGDLTASATATSHADISSTLQCGSITIVKDALPNDAQDFSFSADTAQPTTIPGF
jgi:hypothetical protein